MIKEREGGGRRRVGSEGEEGWVELLMAGKEKGTPKLDVQYSMLIINFSSTRAAPAGLDLMM